VFVDNKEIVGVKAKLQIDYAPTVSELEVILHPLICAAVIVK
jgi:hypothetical protein